MYFNFKTIFKQSSIYSYLRNQTHTGSKAPVSLFVVHGMFISNGLNSKVSIVKLFGFKRMNSANESKAFLTASIERLDHKIATLPQEPIRRYHSNHQKGARKIRWLAKNLFSFLRLFLNEVVLKFIYPLIRANFSEFVTKGY